MGEFLVNMLVDGIFAGIAAIGFSSISNTPRRTYIVCAIAAAVGHALRFFLTNQQFLGLNIIPASALASFAVGLVAVLSAPLVKCPAEVCLFPSLLPMIPGMYAYRAVRALLGCLSSAGEDAFDHWIYLLNYNGITCTFIILGMVLGANIPIFMFKKISFRVTR